MSSKVVLVSPPARRQNLRPPLGLMYISSYLTEKGIQNDILDLKRNVDEDEIIKIMVQELVKMKPEFIGISCMTSDVRAVLKLSKEIKKKLKNSRIVVGGIHPTLFPKEMLTDAIDFVVLGEGEQTFYNLITAKDVSKLDNIAYKNNGRIIVNKIGPGAMVENLDELPFPAFDKIDMEYYLQVTHHLVRGVPLRGFYIFASRGCPYRCTFCVNKNLFQRKIRFRSPKKVVDEIEFLYKKYNIDGFYLCDDTFAVRKKDAIEFCKELVKRDLPIVWGCETRVNLVDEELIASMKKAKCMQVDIGVEAGNQEMLDAIKKDITLEQVKETVRLCKKYGIRVFSNFMINLPNETEQDLKDTINLAKNLKSNITIFNITCPFPGTDIYEDLNKKLTLDDYDKMSSIDSFEDYVDLIENRCRLSKHEIPIENVLKMIAKQMPTPRSISLRMDAGYIANFFRYFSFVLNEDYWNCLLKSKNKVAYLRYIFKSEYIKYFKNLLFGIRVRKE